MFDIVYVSYNSEKWIGKCFKSLLNLNYDLKKVNIYVVDNNSSDGSVQLLRNFKGQAGARFGSFSVFEEKINWGFGKANNIGFFKGNSEFVCFLNIDTELFNDTLQELNNEIIKSDENVGIWEFRQFPYEHPKIYDPLTGSTPWSSGAAFAVRRSVYEQVNGFDENIFMYAEDVDLSWRIRAAGYILKYVPRVKIMHYSYETANTIKPNQHIFGVINNLLLRYRFGSIYDVLLGHLMFWKLICVPEAFSGAKKRLLREYCRHFGKIWHFRPKKLYKKRTQPIGCFFGYDYAPIRSGAYYYCSLPDDNPLVSIIVRTCGRPSVLRETLISLEKQTYDNIEIVIVEDGEPISKQMIDKEFSHLNILYKATGEKVGRSKAGNIAMRLSNGQYLNFLDDDDIFYADHVEVLVTNILKSGKMAAYATAFETPIKIESKNPYIYSVEDYLEIHKQSFDKIILCHHNYIPIQCIMFSKILFELYGGLDESVDALEDWDMWVRYSLYTDFEFILKTTSIYRVPASKKIDAKRQKDLDNALIVMRKKHKEYKQELSVYDIALMYEKM